MNAEVESADVWTVSRSIVRMMRHSRRRCLRITDQAGRLRPDDSEETVGAVAATDMSRRSELSYDV